uniref:Uncharacterized protein n=1 Tax=Escherichia coli TaxID=562 RepID=A0A890DJF6_ECOLX|nr:hypothetical protein [Escherichia coli]
MHCARVASHAGDFESAHTIVPYSCGPPCRTVSRLSQALGGEFAAVRSATAMRRRHEVPDRHPNHQGQADVHQVRRPPVAEQPDRGRKHDGRADHAEQTAQPLPMTEPTQRVRQEGQRGKQRQQAAQPIAETTLPSAPVLSAMAAQSARQLVDGEPDVRRPGLDDWGVDLGLRVAGASPLRTGRLRTPRQALGGEFAAVRSATAMRRRHEVPDRHPNHQGQADVHQVRRPPVAEQPDRGRKHDGRADHAEQTAQPLPIKPARSAASFPRWAAPPAAAVCRAGLGQLLYAGLGVVKSDDGLALLEAHIDLAHAFDLGERFLDCDRAGGASHAGNR